MFAIDLAILLLLIGGNALLATSELALISARRARLVALETRGSRGAALARHLAEEPTIFLPTLQVGLTLIGILIGVYGGARLAGFIAPAFAWAGAPRSLAGDLALASAVLLETYLTLVLGELVPKQLALRHPERVAVVLARPIEVLSRVTAPVVWLLGASSSGVLKLLGVTGVLREAVTEEDLKAVLAEGAEVGVLESGEREMIERLLRLADRPVRAIMTARTELVWIDRTAPREKIIGTLVGSTHSRLVVCDGAVDNVVGVVRARDLLRRMLEGGDVSVGAALRQPAVMPDTVTALAALEQLRADPLGMALVMDEYGSFEGVVTAADVLEAIIGEEADVPVDGPAATEYLLDGLMSVDEVKGRLQMAALPEGSFHTLGGLMMTLLRRVPTAGDTIVFGGWRFAVVEMDGRRVALVRALLEGSRQG